MSSRRTKLSRSTVCDELDLQRGELVVVDRHVLVTVVFVALDDIGALDRVAGFAVDELLAHPVAGFRIELVQADMRRLGHRRGQVDRARHQRQAQKSVPACARHS